MYTSFEGPRDYPEDSSLNMKHVYQMISYWGVDVQMEELFGRDSVHFKGI